MVRGVRGSWGLPAGEVVRRFLQRRGRRTQARCGTGIWKVSGGKGRADLGTPTITDQIRECGVVPCPESLWMVGVSTPLNFQSSQIFLDAFLISSSLE